MSRRFVKIRNNNKGSILLVALIFGFVSFSLITIGVSGYAVSENRASSRKHNREMAFQVAEAGINYYRWHLAHNQNDFTDGTGQPGPYVHAYKDKDGNVIGHYSLNITPPRTGSTVVTVVSSGWLDAQPESRRVVRARIGFPSVTDYAFLTNTDVWIGDTEMVHGKFHANGGIRFDGKTDAPLTSAKATYICKAFHGCGNQQKPGIWGNGTPKDYWQFPVPAQDFTAVTAKLAEIKRGAQNGGVYLPSSGKQGWLLRFAANNTFTSYRVTATNCYRGVDTGASRFVSYCIDIKTITTPTVRNMPANGYIFVEDTVWVDGVVNGRATVGTANGKSIIINNNITYRAKDGEHVLGLIGQKDILLPYNSPNNLEIDAVLLAQAGAAKRYYYPGNRKDNLIVYGAVISAGVWTWSWVSGGGAVVSGYINTNSTYDANLTYGPPPGFPVSSEYKLISWEEVE